MKPSLREISKPRTDDGAVSERYMGAACTEPDAQPVREAAATRPSSEGARPWEIAPRKYNAAASRSSRLLPSVSPRETAAAADAIKRRPATRSPPVRLERIEAVPVCAARHRAAEVRQRPGSDADVPAEEQTAYRGEHERRPGGALIHRDLIFGDRRRGG